MYVCSMSWYTQILHYCSVQIIKCIIINYVYVCIINYVYVCMYVWICIYVLKYYLLPAVRHALSEHLQQERVQSGVRSDERGGGGWHPAAAAAAERGPIQELPPSHHLRETAEQRQAGPHCATQPQGHLRTNQIIVNENLLKYRFMKLQFWNPIICFTTSTVYSTSINLFFVKGWKTLLAFSVHYY